MIEKIYAELEKKRGKIEKITESYYRDIEIKNWVDYAKVGGKHRENAILASIAGVDGSFNFKSFIGFSIYAISAVGIGKSIKEEADVDIIGEQRYVDEKIKIKMLELEAKIAEELCEENELVIFDGSFVNNIVIAEERKAIAELEKDYASYLENFKRIIEKNREKIVALSKTSTRNAVFKKKISDMAIYNHATSAMGYSLPEYVFLKNLSYGFTTFYARFEKNKNILCIELPYSASESEVRDVYENIRKNAVNGYPYVLIKAHKRAEIKNRDMERIISLLGITRKTGREVLRI